MNRTEVYTDLNRQIYVLSDFDKEERAVYDSLQQYAKNHTWDEYHNFYMPRVGDLYKARGFNRREITQLPLWEIAQDIGGRLGIAAGLVRPPDYRSDLEELIRTRFQTRREFCEATGISEDMLSHVLAGRKHLAIDTLEKALEKIGFRLQITPCAK